MLNCPDCRYPIPYDDINITKTIAKCKSCDNIFDFAEEEDGSSLSVLSPRRKEIVIPTGIEVLSLMSELEIMIKWKKAGKSFAPFFSVIFFVFSLFFLYTMILSGAYGMIPFLLPFLLAGGHLMYTSLGYFINTTYITVDDQKLQIEHKPIKFLSQRNTYYHPDEIDQLYTRRYQVGSQNGMPVYAFAVEMELKNGKKQSLVKSLHSAKYGRFIEQEIERYLKIQDRPVSGEWSYRG